MVEGDSFALFVRREAIGWRCVAGLAALLVAIPLAAVKTLRSRAIRVAVRAALPGLTADEVTRRTRTFGADLADEPGRVARTGVCRRRCAHGFG